MKISAAVVAVSAFAAASLVQAETPALRRAEEASANVGASPTPGVEASTEKVDEPRCDIFQNFCNHMPPPRIADGATPQAVSTETKVAAEALTNVAETKGNAEGRCGAWNNWCHGTPPPHVVDNAVVAETNGNAEGRCDQWNNWCNHMPPPRIADNATPQAVGAETKGNADDGGRPCKGPACNQEPPSRA